MGLSLIPQPHGGALLSGGKPGNPGHNQHTVRERAQAVRGELVAELEGAAKDLDPRAAREITKALRQFQSAVEKVALEQQVNELKAQLKELKKRCVA